VCTAAKILEFPSLPGEICDPDDILEAAQKHNVADKK
jgi:hypothetical protein